jgi:protoporphyrinogen oxidase
MKVGIIGAGPAGMTAAYQLARSGVRVEVFEASPHVGGLARTLDLWGQRVDLGPHRFFSRDHRVNHVWHEVAAGDYQVIKRLTRIYYDDKYYDYPLRPANALQNMGVVNAVSCVMSYARQRMRNLRHPAVPTTFEEWIVASFGAKLFGMFFKSYSEKLWGIRCDELDADFAAQRIKKFSLGGALLSALGLDRDRHTTLADEFPHPLAGTGMIYQRMAASVRENGGAVHLSTPVAGLTAEGAGLRFPDGRTREFDHIISTMPLTRLVKSLPGISREVEEAITHLTYRNTILVYLRVNNPELFPDQWLYVQSPELRVGRITNFRNWGTQLHGDSNDTILALEYWCDTGDPVWTADDDELVGLGTGELRMTGLLDHGEVLAGHVLRLPCCYPVYRAGYKQWLAPVVEHLRGLPRVTAIGRYGSFKYNNQDHSILMGLLASENILGQANHDLWSINTDYDEYQEQAPR